MKKPAISRWTQQSQQLGMDPVPTEALLSEDCFRLE